MTNAIALPAAKAASATPTKLRKADDATQSQLRSLLGIEPGAPLHEELAVTAMQWVENTRACAAQIAHAGAQLMQQAMLARERDYAPAAVRDTFKALLVEQGYAEKTAANRASDVLVVMKAKTLPEDLPGHIQAAAAAVRELNKANKPKAPRKPRTSNGPAATPQPSAEDVIGFDEEMENPTIALRAALRQLRHQAGASRDDDAIAIIDALLKQADILDGRLGRKRLRAV